ncbi:hypothetical protein CHS0354_033608 [Potamilus streckersoni]|uniref:Uncharacterized protein n=1 Tax=Potamilus streckersoni TaxID=2493646 RepID=A0AAE0T0V2_9BIVA|nr:hypothetical protein CHS0354_033608 [Potamilus streckersoni]
MITIHGHKKNNIKKPAAGNIKNNPIVDEFLKTYVGERIKQTHVVEIDQDDKCPQYYRYDARDSQDPYEAKKSYLNNNFQCDVGNLPAEQNSTHMKRAQRVIVDKFHQDRVIETEVFPSDKISPKEKLAKIRKLLTLLDLPDIVPDDLLVTTIPISGSDLRMHVEDMNNDPDLLQNYNDLLSNWSNIFPESRLKREPKLTVSNVIEKIKMMYKSFGASLKANHEKNPSRSDYTLNNLSGLNQILY